MLQEFQTLHAGLNTEQVSIFSAIMESYENKTGGIFVYGRGGTRKMYLWKTIVVKVRSERKYVVSIASSGIAALLLPSGRTAHSRFKIPLELNESSCCTINRRTDLASLIQ